MDMKALYKSGSVVDIFQRKYNVFCKSCLNSSTPIEKIKFDFYSMQDLFVRSGQVQTFVDKTSILCNVIENIGNTDISDLLINELCKF